MPTTKNGYYYEYWVRNFTQKGQTCGIYALEAALKALGKTQFPARANGVRTTKLHLKKLDGKDYQCYSLRKLSKLTTKSRIGEIFHVNELADLAKRTGINAKVEDIIKNKLKEQIETLINNKRLLLIPFCPGETKADLGKPSDIKGNKDNGHWCVAFAYHKKNGIVLTVHGWGKQYKMKIDELERSNGELHRFTCSRWYKYIGNERKLKAYKDDSDYFDYMTWKKILTKAYGKKLPRSVVYWLTDQKEFKSSMVPFANLSVGLAHKMVSVWK
jgi:hypothetical protein